jgi:hypothetical protein
VAYAAHPSGPNERVSERTAHAERCRAVRIPRDFDASDADLEALFEDAPIEPVANG